MDNEQTVYQDNGITIGQIILLVKKNLLMIILVTILFTAVGSVYGFFFKPITYTARADLIVVVGDESPNPSTSQYTTSAYHVNTVKEFIVGNSVLEDVKEKTGIDKADLKKNLTITTTSNSLVVSLSFSSTTEGKAEEVVNSFANSTKEVADRPTIADGYLANKIKVLNLATEETAKRGAATVVVISFLIGAIISFAIVLIKFLMNDTFTNKEEIEKMCGTSVLALIEDIGGEE